ncbi:uncharacterized protein [Euwallacea similis]|uniref:uncharacterized protein n=1 Tax=Euwallacea similis TaxID=1736056 RepID=UPI00344E4286
MLVGGLGLKTSEITHSCNVEVYAQRRGYQASLKSLVLPRITGFIPGAVVDISRLNIPSNITLADPEFNGPGPIDLLICSELFYRLLCVCQISLGPNSPILQKTRFGWVVFGSMMQAGISSTVCNLSINSRQVGREIEFDLKKFWEVEDNFAETKVWSAKELAWEEHFQRTHRRSYDGRFVVAIPFKHPVTELGNSKEKAFQRFLSLERKLSKDQGMKNEYCKFISEYLSLRHMPWVLDEDDSVSYYMPHHPVIKSESCTTKLRVVFDCSMPFSTDKSLNELQMVGSVIQPDLFDILISFREFRFVVSADIAKMYRESPSAPIEVFELNTVTYGQAGASFLAVRCLHQTDEECELDVSSIIKLSFYVDDFLHSVDSIEEGVKIGNTVSAALSGGGFKLRKWISNEPAILGSISQGSEDFQVLDFNGDDRAKILGLTWQCLSDILSYKIRLSEGGVKVTKRTILSCISQVFDPLGLLFPSIIVAKILIQKLLLEKLSWDESVPAHLHTAWVKFRSELPSLNKINIYRHIACLDAVRHELHGFLTPARNGDIAVRLLCAKSKVNTLKSLTIPRLELCGALVMARLMNKIKTFARLQFDRCWNGPSILHSVERHWPNTFEGPKEVPEVHIPKGVFALVSAGNYLFERYSDFNRLIRITACMLHFIRNCHSRSLKRDVLSGSFSSFELNDATKTLVKIAQRDSFPDEFDRLIRGIALNPKSKVLSLSPFVDSEGVMRKLPMLLSPKHRLSRMLCEHEHKRLIHAGPQLLLSSMREKFWIIVSRSLIRATVKNSITCLRFNPQCLAPIMGDRSQDRLIGESVFSVEGVDYTGPLHIRDKKGRGSRLSKCYVSVFICFATKALHLELVSDFSNDLVTFIRIMAQISSVPIGNCQTSFMPTQSPHFGGLWEAGVKSVKHHLKKVAGNANLTFEQLVTLLAQIEAILNSRPLSPIIQLIKQHFWKRWSKEYISELQQRVKWKTQQQDIQEGVLVLIKENNLLPSKWRTGRIVAVHPGRDGVNRVATIKTSSGLMKRSFSKICSLPVETVVEDAANASSLLSLFILYFDPLRYAHVCRYLFGRFHLGAR